jgi:ubiquitin-conjugating enzyme E2 Q
MAYVGNDKEYIMGLFQVKNDKSNYKKSGNIHVVPNKDEVVMRGIVFYPNRSCDRTMLQFDMNTLSQYLKEISTKHGSSNSSSSTSSISNSINSKSNKRLAKEFQMMSNNKDIGFSFELKNDSLHNWIIRIDRSKIEDSKSQLVQDMIKYNVNEIIMEILFEETYPFNPPFIRLVSPLFKIQTGHVTSGGSICMEILCTGKWSPACSLESLIIQIKCLILEGEGRLDPNNYHKSYTLAEAKESFVRVGKSHGWL